MLAQTASLYKKSFSGLTRGTWLNALALLTNRSGTMVVPFMTLYLTDKEMGHSLSEAGVVMSLFGLGSIAGAYIGGWFSDRIGFFRVQIMSLVLGGLMFFVLGQVKSYSLICFLTFLLAAVNEAFRPANSAATTHYSRPESITRSFSLNRLAINLGWALGATIGGLIAAYNYHLLFWVDGGTNLVAAIVMLVFLKNPGHIKKSSRETIKQRAVNSAYKDKEYLMYLVLLVLFSVCFFQLFTTVPNYFRDHLELGEAFIGLVMALNGLIIVVFEMILVYRLEGNGRLTSYMAFGTMVCGLSFLSLLLPGNPVVIVTVMILIITAGEIIAMPFMNTYAMERATENNRGQYAAMLSIAWSIGQSCGPAICSFVAEKAGFSAMFVLVAGTFFATAIGFLALGHRRALVK